MSLPAAEGPAGADRLGLLRTNEHQHMRACMPGPLTVRAEPRSMPTLGAVLRRSRQVLRAGDVPCSMPNIVRDRNNFCTFDNGNVPM